jgi:hypothetical protein
VLTRTQGLLHSGIRLTHRQRRPEVQSQTSSPIRSLSTPTGYAVITTRTGINDATCRSVRLAGQDTSTTQKPTSRHVLSRTQRLLHSGVNSHSSSCTTLSCLHRKGRDGLNTELPAIGHTTLSILAKHHVGRSHIIRLSGTVRNTTQASVSFIAR